MDRDAVGTCFFTRDSGGDYARFWRTTRLPHGCDVIDIDV